MPQPGKNVTTLEKPAITFGDSDDVEEKYGGYAYQLDFNLALVEPMRMSISFISEDGSYDEDTLNDELDNLTNDNPTTIKYCGGTRTFQGYPLKYSINSSPQGNILTVEYYDTSIGELDNRIVVLNGKDVPLFEDSLGVEIPEDSPIKYKYVDTNPCSAHILNIGREYVSTSTGVPQGTAGCADSDEVKEVLYTNRDLYNLLVDVDIPMDEDTADILQRTSTDEAGLFFENYHGTLREVLKQWGDRMGFTFYWDSEASTEADDQGGARSGKLTFIDLRKGLTFKDLENTSKKMLEACNLLESTKTVAKDNTFNKAISANYTTQGIGMAERTENFMLLDFLTCPLRGCVTSEGKVWDAGEYPTGVKDTDARHDWRTKKPDWYKEWDNPLYINTTDDTQDREWLEYQPLRPTESSGDSSTESEFRDLIRLIKAAAIGEDFFNAYMFFKAMKSSLDLKNGSVGQTLEQYMSASGTDSIGTALNNIYINGLKIDASADAAGMELSQLRAQYHKPEFAGWDTALLDFFITEALGKNEESNGGFTVSSAGDSDVLIPDLTENIVVTKLLSNDPGNADMPSPPVVKTPNILICRNTVLGMNCLTVKPLDPSFQATRNLYTEISADVVGGGGCGATNRLIDADDAKFTNVWRTYSPTKWKKEQAVDKKNGSPWIFSYTHKYGNSDVLNTGQNALYRQLRYIAENAGRFWVSPSVITRREFNNRNYNKDGIKFIPRDLDVLDSDFRDFFQEFDPMAGEAAQPFSKSEYDKFWGTEIDKNTFSGQKQLNGWEGDTKPDSEEDIPCGRGDGKDFSPDDSDTAENTKAPNVQQMIEKIIERTLIYSSDCDATGEPLSPPLIADSTSIDLTGLESGRFGLKNEYRIGDGFTGGAGYSSLENNGDGPKIIAEFSDAGGEEDEGSLADLEISCEVIAGVITRIMVLNAADVKLVRGDPDGGLGVKFVFEDPPSGDRGFFGDPVDMTSMNAWDSITSTNLNLLNLQRQQSCCCVNDEKGVVILDKGSQLRVVLPEDVKKIRREVV